MKRKKRERYEAYDDENYDDEEYLNEILYKEGYQPPKKKKKRTGVFTGLLIFFLGIAILVLSFILLFHIQKIEVTGNQYCTEQEVVEWIQSDKYAVNTVYVWLKYNFTKVAQLPLVEDVEVAIKNPWTLKVKVREKEVVGYIDLGGEYVCFDKEGIAVFRGAEIKEGISGIEGLEVDAAQVALQKVLPVSNKDIFEQIVEASRVLKKYALVPDRIVCSQEEVLLYFGGVAVRLGKDNYEDKIAQISPILAKLSEQYPGQAGVLHLENYGKTNTLISFVPGEVIN